MPNPFDQFDAAASNPFDQFDPDPVHQIPGLEGTANSSMNVGKDGSSVLDKGLGLIEAGASAVSGIPATIGEGIGQLLGAKPGAVSKEFYQPRTEKGKEYTEDLGEFANRYLNPLLGGIGHAHIPEKLKGVEKDLEKPSTVADAIAKTKEEEALGKKPANPFDQFDAKATDGPDGQLGLFDMPEGGRQMPNPYEVTPGDWRIDENGMPIKADLSMDAANAEHPLQRDMFGDQLAPKHELEGTPIPEAMDDTRAAGRAAEDLPTADAQRALGDEQVRRLSGEIEPPNELKTAARDAVEPLSRDGTGGDQSPLLGPGRSQAGAINPDVFVEGFAKAKDIILDGIGKIKIIAHYEPKYDELRLDAYSIKDGGVPIGGVSLQKEGTNLKSFSTRVSDEYQRKGVATELYKYASELGNDIIPSTDQSYKGKGMWQGFENKGLSQNGIIRSPGNRQMGGVWMGAEPAKPTPRPDTIGEPRSPENIAAKNEQRKFVERFPGKDDALAEFKNVTTKEEAVQLASDPNVKDIVRDVGQKQLGSGINFHAAMSNNPVLKFARYVYQEARVKAEALSRRYITDNKTGLTYTWTRMKGDERIAVMEALMEGDRQQFRVNDSVMEKLGFTDEQKKFVETYYEANDKLYKRWQEVMSQAGLKAPDARTGHFPGIFTGAYKTLVVKTLPNGKKSAVGIIATDTKWQRKAAIKYFKKEHPEATFIDQERSGLSGSSPRYYSNIFSGMNDVLEMLGKEDPRFADVQELVQKAVVEGNNKLFNFNVHELAKKGVVGNEGNRPWLKPEQNANDAFKALVRYFEDGFLHHELQLPLKDVREVMANPDLAKKLPNTMKYLNAYTKKVTGADLAPLGAAINTILDTPFKVIGVGPSVPLRVAGAIKNNMSQIFMGYGNYMFTLSQLIQPAQTAYPFAQLAAKRLGMDLPSATRSMVKGGADFLLAYAGDMTGKNLDALPEHMRTAYQYAKERGMLTFSEIERAYQGTQSTLGRAKDSLAEANMKVGENATRTPTFMAYVDLLTKGGVDLQAALPIAEHMTQFSMVDYHPWERPMLYSKMGVLGQFAGGLQTFKHGQLSQQTYLAKQAIKPAVGEHQVKPFLMSVAAMIALAGITGTPGYDILDGTYRYLTNKFGGEAKSIRESFLEHSPEWLNTGIASNITGLNIQGKFSAADMVGDSLGKVASPHLEAFSKIVANAIDMAKSGADPQSIRNFMLSVTPAGWKGVTENALARDPENYLIGSDGLKSVQRSNEEWKTRAATGLRPQREAIERETTWTARIKERKDLERKKEISAEYERRIINGTLDDKAAEKLQKEYMDRKGDVRELINLESTVPVQKIPFDQKERLEGIPRSLGGANRYQYYNK